jgi:hypothetical protein
MNEVVWHQDRHHHSSHHQSVHAIHHSVQSSVSHNHHNHNHNHQQQQSTQQHNVMLTNGQSPQSVQNNEMQNAVHKHNQNSIRSQDDAMVGYFFQRPQTDPDFQNYGKQSRWALGDDSVLEVFIRNHSFSFIKNLNKFLNLIHY